MSEHDNSFNIANKDNIFFTLLVLSAALNLCAGAFGYKDYIENLRDSKSATKSANNTKASIAVMCQSIVGLLMLVMVLANDVTLKSEIKHDARHVSDMQKLLALFCLVASSVANWSIWRILQDNISSNEAINKTTGIVQFSRETNAKDVGDEGSDKPVYSFDILSCRL